MRLLVFVSAGILSACGNSSAPLATPANTKPAPRFTPETLLADARTGTASLARAIDSRQGVIHLDYAQLAYVDNAVAIEEHVCGEHANELARSLDENLQVRAKQNDTASDVPRCAPGRAGEVTCRWGATGEGSASMRLDFVDGDRGWHLVRVAAFDAVGTESWDREQSERAAAALKRLAGATCQ